MNSSTYVPGRSYGAIHSLTTALLVLAVGTTHAQTVLPPDAKPLCAVAQNTFNSWFASGTPSLNGVVNPANSITFPNNSDCAFYQWSEQMFLWLTSPAPASYGGGKSFIFNSPSFFNITGPITDSEGNTIRRYVPNLPGAPLNFSVRSAQAGPNGLQRVFDKSGRAFEILPSPQAPNGQSLIRNSAGKFTPVERIEAQSGKKPTFFAAGNKKIALPAAIKLDPTAAARVAPHLLNLTTAGSKRFVQGIKNGRTGNVVFIDMNGNSIEPTQGQAGGGAVLLAKNGSLVYYAAMVNDVFAFFQTGVANGALPATNFFPTTQAQVTPVVNYAASKGVKIPDQEALAVEIKTSWIEPIGMSAAEIAGYVTIIATVPTYDTSSNQMWVPNGSKTIPLILVGMHVVGSANGHPEMIWATFEHVTNSPNNGYSYTNTANQTIQVPQSSSGNWLFSSTSSPAATYNTQKAKFNSGNQSITAVPNQVISPSDTLRWNAWGSTATNLTQNTNILSSNNSVRSQLSGGDVRGNYILTGSTWFINGGNPPGNTTNAVGTNILSNTTMETYDQGSPTRTTGDNCLVSCHGGNTTSVSHIYPALVPLFPN